ncbi:hypothetical protein HELRODRAFT_173987 [Helobdella robusta]|uniref:Uncharacterized protein n=1 Tax=Helobdella robusta TaxID=6412 RepID=T1F7G3_HELRO|nr:hypothetical protein HELRODRAFT_173987 [Helobdella robusta]ESO03103.1 hypothetical protein HELRODRAFT_173987 [Helobdella robusta]
MESTSVRRVSKFFKSSDAFLKVLWLILLLGSTSYMTTRLYKLLKNYYAYPLTSDFRENTKIFTTVWCDVSIAFLDITICNLDLFAAAEPKEMSMNEILSNLIEIKNKFFKLRVDESISNNSEDNIDFENVFKDLATNECSLLSFQSRGVKVSVQSPGALPDLKRGFNVAPETENIVEIIQTERRPHNKQIARYTRWDVVPLVGSNPGKCCRDHRTDLLAVQTLLGK